MLAAVENHRIRPENHRVGFRYTDTPGPSGLYPGGAPSGPEFLLEGITDIPEEGAITAAPMEADNGTQNTGNGDDN